MVEQKQEEASSSLSDNSSFKLHIYKATGCVFAARFSLSHISKRIFKKVFSYLSINWSSITFNFLLFNTRSR